MSLPKKVHFPTVQTTVTAYGGGINENVSSLELGPGELLSISDNYYIADGTTGGYRSIKGYERFDGKAKPSSVAATELDYTTREAARSAIDEVPGIGNVLGLFVFNNKVYAFRNKATVGLDPLIAGMYVESAAGWVEINTSAHPLSQDGSIESVEYNFLSTPTSNVVIWIDGVNKARMFDGTTITLIDNTGMGANDKPTHLAVHQDRLFLSYAGGSIQYTNVGDPTDWSAGSGELGFGYEVTSLTPNVGGTLLVTSKSFTKTLEGDSELTWTFKTFSDHTGAYSKTLNKIFDTVIFMSDAGVTTLASAQEFGSFKSSTISPKIGATLIRYSQTVSTAIVIKQLNQYRLFFTNNKCFVFSFSGKNLKGVTKVSYNIPVYHVVSSVSSSGVESIFFSSTGGYVYQMDSGTSFDGAAIKGRLAFPFYHHKSPRNLKRFLKLTGEVVSSDDMTVNIKTFFNYSASGVPKGFVETGEIYGDANSFYGISKWGTMKYGGTAVTNVCSHNINGIGFNMSVQFFTESAFNGQHTFQNCITDYEVLGRSM